MNLGDSDESPWGDVQGNSPRAASPAHNTNSEQPPQACITQPADSFIDHFEHADSFTAQDTSSSQSSSLPAPRAPIKTRGGKSTRITKTAPSTRLESLGDDFDPLGPLGSSTASPPEIDEPPELPQKEQPRQRPTSSHKQPVESSTPSLFGAEADGIPTRARQPQSQPTAANDSQTPGARPPNQPRLPIFNIYVGDPHKVGDLTSSHTVYQVRTKTNSKAFLRPDFEVSRRYRDFLWLYNQLHANNPGLIVPPPPEKQTVGRFETDFIETRRSALERMMNKISLHPVFQNDSDFKLFLESDSFTVDVKHRERKDPDMPTESKGMFSGLNMSSGSGGKFVEHDDWFLERRVYLDGMETQLKSLLKALDTTIAQRKGMAEAADELSVSLNNLSQVELSPILTGPLASLSDVYIRIRELNDRQALQDDMTLGNTMDEYIRLIGSVKKAFEQRQRTWHGWHNAESDLQKRRSALDKLMRQGRTQQDKMSQLQADVGDAERRAHQARLHFESIGRGMRVELERFEKEKVDDFRMGVETYLEASVEAQKELIEIWETYLFHLEQDDEERNKSNDSAPRANPPLTTQQPTPEHQDGRASVEASSHIASD